MRAFAIVLLAAVAVRGEAEADAYTMGQVALGLTHGGVITGVDYGNGVVSGVGAIGNRAVTYAYPAVHTLATHAVHPVATSAVYSNVVNPAVHTVAAPAMYSGMYSRMMHYGKREAEAEPEAEADPYLFTNNLVHYPVSTVAAVSPVAAVRTVVPANLGLTGFHHYGTTGMYGMYGKREAEAEPEPYTMGQVALGLTHGGVITGVDYGNDVVSGAGAIGNRAITYASPAVHTVATHAVHPVATSAMYSNVVTPAVHTVAAPAVHTVATHAVHPVATSAVYSNVVTPAVHTVAAPAVHTMATHAVHPVATSAMYSNVVTPEVHTVAAPVATHGVYSNLGLTGFHQMMGKREAEAEPEADPLLYTNSIHNTGVYTAPISTVATIPAVHTVSPYTAAVTPAVSAFHTVNNVVSPFHTVNNMVSPVVRTVAPYATHGVYSNLGLTGFHHYGTTGMYGMYGKREAEAEPEPYTIEQVAAGLPVINAYATGHPHNIGYTTNVAHSVYPFTRFARFGYPHMF